MRSAGEQGATGDESDVGEKSATSETAHLEKPTGAERDFARTLEHRLGTEDFARRGWQRLLELADYVAHLVDGRTTGVLATESRGTYLRVLSLATTLKATAQWFALDHEDRPKFVVEAEKYLADAARGRRIAAPTTIAEDELPQMLSGPVAPRKGGRGAAGRLHALAELKRDIVELLRPLEQKDLQRHLRALRDPESEPAKEAWPLVSGLADCILFAVMNGLCADLLREQAFEWPPWDVARLQVVAAIHELLNDVSVAAEPAATREERLAEIAERMIRVGLAALGIRAEKDFFRERRDR